MPFNTEDEVLANGKQGKIWFIGYTMDKRPKAYHANEQSITNRYCLGKHMDDA